MRKVWAGGHKVGCLEIKGVPANRQMGVEIPVGCGTRNEPKQERPGYASQLSRSARKTLGLEQEGQTYPQRDLQAWTLSWTSVVYTTARFGS